MSDETTKAPEAPTAEKKTRRPRMSRKSEAAVGGPERLVIQPGTAQMIANWVAQRDALNARINETIGVLVSERKLEGEIRVGRLVSENGSHYFEYTLAPIAGGPPPAAAGGPALVD